MTDIDISIGQELLLLIAEIDECKGKWQALNTLALTLLLGVLFDKIAAVTALALTIFLSEAGLPSTQLRWIEPYTV